ncbi:MAG: hypothetical protein MUC49_05440 [Raineya sp.]|jgi:hypothetical protein|nr:hypothetical protein [Raineya sp.]
MKSFEDIINCLKDIFNWEEYSLDTLNVNNVVLTEHKPDATLRKIEIQGLSESYLAIKLDAFEPNQISQYFNTKSKSGINKGCDGVIFTCFDNFPYIIFCEMKSSYPSKKDYLPQLQNSNCFIDFINILLQEHYECNLDDFKRKYILFYRDREADEAISLTKFKGKASSPDKIKDNAVNKVVVKYRSITTNLIKLLTKPK